ncbi:cGMP-specific 3 3' [Octopus vulgaris]|uniref:Phosphodiesterase n=1 Tax=Octopus vulgaris TaxID=6645 RepID=A0AA36BUV3_OCTVU|nr:cGMP-specific 3 3' [Octopus vulgaris]
MMDDLQQDEVENFLQNNPDFVRKWQSRHSTEDDKKESFIDSLQGEEGTSSTIHPDELDTDNIKTRKYIAAVTENELYREFIKDTVFSIDVDKQCHKILQNACIILDCDRASLFLLHGIAKKLHLVSKFFDVTATSVMEDTIHNEENAIRIPFGKGIVGYVAEYSCLLNIKDAYEDERFLHEIDKSTGFCTKSILSVPITDRDGVVIGVAQALNKKHDRYFDSNDENIFQNFSSFCGISINNEQLLEISQVEFKRHKLLLKLAKFVLKEQINFRKLISEILRHAMDMLNCSKICVYLTENRMDAASPTISSKVFQLLKDEEEVKEVPLDPKYIIPIDQNLKSINIIDIIRLQSESKELLITVEGDVGRWLLCMTITNATSEVVGCIIFERHSKDVFDQSDINLMETFALICGISIHNCRIYERSVRMLAQGEVMNDVLAFHTTCDRKLIEPFLKVEPRSAEEYQLYSYAFIESVFTDDEIVSLCARVFLDKNALTILNLPIDILYRFILTAKKNYRPNIFHNWRHGVLVFQMMFYFLTCSRIQYYFTEFEQICSLIASLLHDLDHRGTNNKFQVKISSPLTTLYDTSVLEHHHIDRAIRMLNTAETNIFQNLSAENYQHGLKFIEKAILGTDVKDLNEVIKSFREEIKKGDKGFQCQESIDLLITVIMAACDLSAATKPWSFERNAAVKIAAEFFEQGDQEKTLQQDVEDLMDRENRYKFPEMEVKYFDTQCVPIFQVLSEMDANLTHLYEGALENRNHWAHIAEGIELFDIDSEIETLYNEEMSLKEAKYHEIVTPKISRIQSENVALGMATSSTQTTFVLAEESQRLRQKTSQTDDGLSTMSYSESRALTNAIKSFYTEKLLAVTVRPIGKRIRKINIGTQVKFSNGDSEFSSRAMSLEPSKTFSDSWLKTNKPPTSMNLDGAEQEAMGCSSDIGSWTAASVTFETTEQKMRALRPVISKQTLDMERFTMSAEEREKISNVAVKDLNHGRRRKCLKKIPRSKPVLTSKRTKRQDDFMEKYVCKIS